MSRQLTLCSVGKRRNEPPRTMFVTVRSVARRACLNDPAVGYYGWKSLLANKTVLLIHGDAAEAKAVARALSGCFRVDWVQHCSEGVERLVRDGKREGLGISAVLVDLFLPDSQGIETFDQLSRVAPRIPILVLCAERDERVAKLAMQRGAPDYLLKTHVDAYWLSKALHNVIERAANAETLFEERQRAQVTLESIGDAVISTDVRGHVTSLNGVAERLMCWTCEEATGRPIEEVFRIIDASTREAMPNPPAFAIRDGKTLSLPRNGILVSRNGAEVAINDSAAPIRGWGGRIIGSIVTFQDVSAARALALRMSYLAQHDSLTDLPNRQLFSERLTEAIAMAHVQQQKLAVLYLDVDRFKNINDSLGSDIGDRLLQLIATRLLDCVRSVDTVSRAGSDEFVVLLSGVKHARSAALMAKKILLMFRTPHRIEQHDLHFTVSIGIAMYPDDGMEAESLEKNADFAMYHAKESGRNNYQFFKPDMNLRALERQLLENGLRRALERQELVLHYQPEVNLQGNAIVGVEALVRWQHPQHGLVSPAQFLPVAEERGFIVPIGRWILREACSQARAWHDAGVTPIRVAVNISAVELRDREFVAGVRSILMETGVDPTSVELELTETFLLQDSKSTTAVLHALKGLGVGLALDDFGTGYSSLSHLRRFPIDSLKIDQSFVRNIATDADDASIVSAVISMGKSLQMRVVAEGVETRAQLAFLQQQSCPAGQGYYFSHPVASPEIGQLFARGVWSALP
jgi:diguanylate cyclase (GGDEF)-like protein/PAS domain S-box-containing protein